MFCHHQSSQPSSKVPPDVLDTYLTPANQAKKDFAGNPEFLGLFEKWWSNNVIATTDSMTNFGVDNGPTKPSIFEANYHNVLFNEKVAERKIVWSAFPRKLLLDTINNGTPMEDAYKFADALIENGSDLNRFKRSLASQKYIPQNAIIRQQDEYCEWFVHKNAEGGLTRVDFTSEPPEYYMLMWQLPGGPQEVLRLYQTFVSPDVELEDLVLTSGPYKGGYNMYNDWNGRKGAMHLQCPPNSLAAEIILGGDCSIVRGYDDDSKQLIEDGSILIATGQYGGATRNSDPHIGEQGNLLARNNFNISVTNPVALYQNSFNGTGLSFDGINPLTQDQVNKIAVFTRGDIHQHRGLRCTIQIPPDFPKKKDGTPYIVSDLYLGGVKIKYGGQLAEQFLIQLTAQAVAGNLKNSVCVTSASDNGGVPSQIATPVTPKVQYNYTYPNPPPPQKKTEKKHHHNFLFSSKVDGANNNNNIVTNSLDVDDEFTRGFKKCPIKTISRNAEHHLETEVNASIKKHNTHSLKSTQVSNVDAKVKSNSPPPVTGAEIDVDEIQGRSILGFNKDHYRSLIFDIPATANLATVKAFLAQIKPTNCRDIIDFRVGNRATLLKNNGKRNWTAENAVAWVEMSFGFHALKALLPSPDYLKVINDEDPFKIGFPGRGGYLGDDSKDFKSWEFGKASDHNDILIVIEADTDELVQQTNDQIKKNALAAGLKLVHAQVGGKNINGDGDATNMFNFRDGISQPDIDGYYKQTTNGKEENVLFSKRYIDQINSANQIEKRWKLYGIPGNDLVPLGEFIFGYPKANGQVDIATDNTWTLTQSTKLPKLGENDWMKNGSYVVFRKLRMFTAKFEQFCADEAKKLNISSDKVAALIFGRWKNGEPLMRYDGADAPPKTTEDGKPFTLGSDKEIRNNFFFQSTWGLLPLNGPDGKPIYPYEKNYPLAVDPLAKICPFAAHIRKMNPRDVSSDQGPPSVTQTHRIMRKASNYGAPINTNGEPNSDDVDRGLLFFAYQTDLKEQFEFLQRQWSNSEDAPIPGGRDLIIGQNPADPERKRSMEVNVNGDEKTLIAEEFVKPTGSGYFFAPSIATYKLLAGTQ